MFDPPFDSVFVSAFANVNVFARLLISLAFVISTAVVFADDAESSRSLELFEKHIRPTFVEHCIRCHGSKKQQANLRLDTKSGWNKGGDTGPAIVAGDTSSVLLNAIRYEDTAMEMPPRGKLSEATIAAFEEWVALGAVDPRGSDKTQAVEESSMDQRIEQGREFWAFRAITKPKIPVVQDRDWPLNDIDRFVMSSADSAGLVTNPATDRRTFARRIHYDLLGLPPTPDQIEEFVHDDSPQAFENLVDRLLSSPQFGQRFGRHWLDVVRFAESSGGGRTLLFPDAWRYRDYVIDSLNEDVPYNQFLREQIAGDLLDTDDVRQRTRNLSATAFWLLGPTNYEMQDKDLLEMDVVDEQIDTMGKALLGMTIGCARCHDHKFDPIPAHDYYALAGILKSTQSLVHSNVSKWTQVALPLTPTQERPFQQHQSRLKRVKKQLQIAKQQWSRAGGVPDKDSPSIDPALIDGIVVDDTMAEKVGEWIESASLAGYVGDHYLHDSNREKGLKEVVFRPELPVSARYEVRLSYASGFNRSTRVPVRIVHRDGETVVTVNQKSPAPINRAFESLGTFYFEVDGASPPSVAVTTTGTNDGVVIADAVAFLVSSDAEKPKPATDPRLEELKSEVAKLEKQLRVLNDSAPKRSMLMATQEATQPGDIHLAIRGVASLPGPLTSRGALQVASWDSFPAIAADESGRRQLADWITDARNPLTARVFVNRVWYWLIGNGIVSTVDNFGTMGQAPSHPELLDYLASEFVANGWSIKTLVRQIVLSQTYRMSSQVNNAAHALDPDNRLLWRMNRKRFRAEDVRDSLLAVAGKLDQDYGGSNIKTGTSIEYNYQFDSSRRSVYVPVFRNTLPEIFEAFDFADPNIQGGKRNASTVASQALLLMNHPWVHAQAKAAATRMLDRGSSSQHSRINIVFLDVLGRTPTPDELQVAVDLLGQSGDNNKEETTERWAMLYQVLFQSIDFRYLN